MKLRSYAQAGIACYWIVDVPHRSVEVCMQPDSRQRRYRKRVVLSSDDTLTVQLNGQKIGEIPVSAVLR